MCACLLFCFVIYAPVFSILLGGLKEGSYILHFRMCFLEILIYPSQNMVMIYLSSLTHSFSLSLSINRDIHDLSCCYSAPGFLDSGATLHTLLVYLTNGKYRLTSFIYVCGFGQS